MRAGHERFVVSARMLINIRPNHQTGGAIRFPTGAETRKSCGIARVFAATPRAPSLRLRGVDAGAEFFIGRGGSCLLRGLLAPTTAVTEELVTQGNPGFEGLRVIRTIFGDNVLRHAERQGCGELLQAGLPVECRPEGCGDFDVGVHQPVHDARGDLNAVLNEHGADERFDGIGENRRLIAAASGFFATTEPKCWPDVEIATNRRERARIDYGSTKLRQLTLREVGKGAVQGVGDDKPENRIPEKFEAFIRGQAAVLICV